MIHPTEITERERVVEGIDKFLLSTGVAELLDNLKNSRLRRKNIYKKLIKSLKKIKAILPNSLAFSLVSSNRFLAKIQKGLDDHATLINENFAFDYIKSLLTSSKEFLRSIHKCKFVFVVLKLIIFCFFIFRLRILKLLFYWSKK